MTSYPRRMLLVVIVVVAAVIAGLVGFVRTAGHDPDVWHVDPLVAPSPSSPNSYRVGPESGTHGATVDPDEVAPVVPVPSTELAAAFDAVANGDDRVEVVAGSAAQGHVTYVQRSKLMGFPDYVSVRFIDLGDEGSTLAVFSRARFGHSDLGVNQKRVEAWVSATTERLG